MDPTPMTSNILRSAYEKYCVVTEWNIGIAEASHESVERLLTRGVLGTVRWMPRRSSLLSRADPFLWPLQGGPRIIYEEIDQRTKIGRIYSMELNGSPGRQMPRAEIVQPFHMSYPFVVDAEDTWYCIPESARSGGIDLYRWDAAGEVWRHRLRLLDDIPLLDGTLLRHEGLWYLLGTVRGHGSYDALRIWWSPALESPWREHASSPVKVDASSSRPAGPFFRFDGHWYRPAQDCTRTYGGALAINRLDALTPTEFAETTVSRVAPDRKGPYPDGLHTLGVYDSCILLDGKRVGFSAELLLMKAGRRIRRVLGTDI